MRAWIAPCLVLAIAVSAPAQESPLHDARDLRQTGRYEEALELLGKQDARKSVALVLEASKSHEAVGHLAEAEQVVAAALEKQADQPELLARLAELHLYRGRWEAAADAADRAIQSNGEQLLARWVRAQLALQTGKLDEAAPEFEWFVHHYSTADLTRPEDLLLIGLGATQYVRWNMQGQEQTEQLNVILNDLYYAAARIDAKFWQGSYAAGLLWLETYARPSAERDLSKALSVNPQAAEVHVALGQAALQDYELDKAQNHCRQALEINPKLISARQLHSDLLLTEEKLAEAISELQTALAVNPRDEETLGRLAACYLLSDGPEAILAVNSQLAAIFGGAPPNAAPAPAPADNGPRFAQLLQQVVQRNPRPGVFLYRVGERLVSRNQFDAAHTCLEQALAVMPKLAAARNELGMLQMRTGREEDARREFDRAFQSDPFHVRTNNMLKVLKLLQQYETLKTEHFHIRFDPEQDQLFARYLADYLEGEHAKLVEQLGYEPKQTSLFEVFNDGRPYEGHRRQSGHEWFSARTIGLPEVHTIGACVGQVVALTSPEEIKTPFNWAHVAKHEYVHVITLEQTNYNIPHWFTEALAVLYEGAARPREWDALLLRRLSSGDLLDLSTINRAFIHPKQTEDRTLAYCQALLYAQHLIADYGPETIHAMLDAYRRGSSTVQAIESVTKQDVGAFEQGYRTFLDKFAAALKPPSPPALQQSFAQLRRSYRADPENADLAAQLALAHLERKQYPEARRLAVKAREIRENHPLASYVMARLSALIGDTESAKKFLEPALDEKNPHPRVLQLIAQQRVSEKNWAEAARLYDLGRRHQPENPQWVAGLVLVYSTQENRGKLAEALEVLAELQQHEPSVRKKLAQMALEDGEYTRAIALAREALHMNVLDPGVHLILGQAHEGLSQWNEAADEYQVTLQLDEKDAVARAALARIREKTAPSKD